MQAQNPLRERRGRPANPIYLISSATRDRRGFLRYYDCGRAVVQSMRRECEAGHTESLAFVVMPDHFHWLVLPKGERPLSLSVNTVKSFSARRINRILGRHGAIWQRGFHDRAIRHARELEHVARYIVANPLRAGLVDTIADYPLWDTRWL